MPIVNFVNEKKQVQVPQGANLRREAKKAGVSVYRGIDKVLNCHGFGMCCTCAVLVTKGLEHASPMGTWEKLMLSKSLAYIGNEKNMRLSCQLSVEGDMDVVTKPEFNYFGENFFS